MTRLPFWHRKHDHEEDAKSELDRLIREITPQWERTLQKYGCRLPLKPSCDCLECRNRYFEMLKLYGAKLFNYLETRTDLS